MLEALTSLMEALTVERRLLVRLAQLVEGAGVGTPAGIRLRRALTHVQWPLLVGADEDALVAAFRGLIGRGWLMVERALPGSAPGRPGRSTRAAPMSPAARSL